MTVTEDRRVARWLRLRRLAAPDGADNLECLSEAEWTDVVDLAVRSDLGPLLWDSMRSRGAPCALPPSLTAQLARLHAASFARYHLVAAAARPHLSALRDHVVDLAVLKGLALGCTVYSAPHVRVSGDLDLLVRRSEAPNARRALRAAGFLESPSWSPHHGRTLWIDARHGVRVSIDLHHDLSSSGAYPMPQEDEIWEGAHSANLWGVEVRVPCLEHMAWHAVQQIASGLLGGYLSLKHMLDLDYIAAQPGYDRNAFALAGRRAGGLGLLKLAAVLREGDRAAGGDTPHVWARLGCSWFWGHAGPLMAGATSRLWRNAALLALASVLDTWPMRARLLGSRLRKAAQWSRVSRLARGQVGRRCP